MMKKNVGALDRVARTVGAAAMTAGAIFAPFDAGIRIGLGVGAGYMLLTALAGTCLGYRMMGRSTCPTDHR